MSAIVGETKQQTFTNPTDTASLTGSNCGEVRVQLTTSYEFLSLTYLTDTDEYLI